MSNLSMTSCACTGTAALRSIFGGVAVISLLALSSAASAGTSTCCFANGAPGCDDPTCQDAVCAADPFCCATLWDSICANAAVNTLCVELCAGGGGCPPSDHDCCTTGAVGCTDTACCDTVCAADPFCCQTAWDGICVGEAVTLCGLDCAACPKSDHDCFTTGAAGCSDVECCEAVCALDLFCCQTAWDGVCVNEALAACTPPLCCNLRCPADLNYDGQVDGGDLGILLADWGATTTCSNLDGQGTVDGGDLGILLAAWGACPNANYVSEGEPCGSDTNGGCNTPPSGTSNCCVANGGLGCDDPDCTATVCGVDPFCCDTAWDGICAGEAVSLCGDLCASNPNFGTIECGDKIIGNAWAAGGIRDTDWYQITIDEPTLISIEMQSQLPMVFGVVDTGGVPDCSLASAINPFGVTGFCGTAEIVDFCLGAGTWWIFAAPNAFDGFPCGANNVYWLELECNGKCAPLSCGNAGHGCDVEGGPFCDDAACCKAVCAVDPFCCDTAWDSICVGEAASICGGGSNCCFANGGAGCDDPTCQNAVCAIDPFCCDTAWDGICAGEAADICEVCGATPPVCPPSDHDCCTAGAAGCTDTACCELVCSADPFCCNNSWDQICIGEAISACGISCGSACDSADHGCDVTGGPGCTDVKCCEAVCAVDPFCCNTSWDLTCVSEAASICGGGSNCCFANGAPGCDDDTCEASVCAIDPFCCATLWDSLCANEAAADPNCPCGG